MNPQARSTTMVLFATALMLALVPLAGSTGTAPADSSAEVSASTGPVDYVDVAEDVGLDFICEAWNKEIGLSPRFFVDAFFCPSPVVADVNGDGYEDLFFPNQRYTDARLNEIHDPHDRLYLNQGDGTFREVTGLVGFQDAGLSMAGAALDHDADGDLDIYVANYPASETVLESPSTTFYENNGDGTFTASVPEGLETRPVDGEPDAMFGSAVAVTDYDGDGDVDVYRGNYAEYALSDGMPANLQHTTPETNLLFENDGDGTFSDVTLATGASQQPGRTFAVNFVDLDEDGWPDLYVANDENPNEVYLNRPDDDGNRVFEKTFSGAEDARGAMCSTTADFDNDGHLDLYMTHYEDETNGYYLGNGDGTFTDAGTLGDLDEASYHLLGWGCPALDADNDGDRDLFVANGHMTPTGGEFLHPDDPRDDNGYALPNQLFLNTLADTGTHSWDEVSDAAGSAFDPRRSTSGAEAVDLDRDGVQEIVTVNNNDATAGLLDNQAAPDHAWLSIDLRASGANTHAIGALVQVTTDEVSLVDHRTTGGSLASGSVAPLHFGLGTSSGPAEVTVDWPDGTASNHTVDLDQHVRIEQDAGVVHDTRAPRADVAYDGTPGEGNWFTSEQVTVTLTAEDPGPDASGTNEIRYALDDGPLQAYEGPFTFTEPGLHTLRVVTEDAAGNSGWFPYQLGIDTEVPNATIAEPGEGTITVQQRSFPTDGDDTWITAPRATRTDALAYTDDVLEGWAHETARRTGLEPVYPASLEEALAGTAGSDGHTTVSVNASDATGGPDKAVFFLDGEERHTDEAAPFTWDGDLRGLETGEHTLRVVVHDRAGMTDEDTRTVKIVPTSPDGGERTAEEPPSPDELQPTPNDAPNVGIEHLLSPVPEDPLRTASDDGDRHWFNGAGSYLPANERDAPIWRQLNFISDDEGGTVGQYVVLNPDTFLTSPEPSNVYQFPDCQSLDPVLDPPLMQPRPPGGEPVAWDRPMRQIVNVHLSTGCEQQPTSVDEVASLAEAMAETGLWVNAPKLPERVADWPDEELFNAPPYRPRIDAFQDGQPVQFITYEASWIEPWVGTNMPGDQDVFILSTSSTFRDDFTLFNVNIGAPNHESFREYSPVWRGNCIVAEDNKKCMISVNQRAGFEQCRTVAECLAMTSTSGTPTQVIAPNTFTHINCPYVAIDTNGNDFVEPHEELFFPNLWVDGPVIVS